MSPSETELMVRVCVSLPTTGMLFKNHWYLKLLAPMPVAKQINSACSPSLTTTPAFAIVTTGGRAIDYK